MIDKMKINAPIVELAANFASNYLSTQLDKKFQFHNFSHTIRVVNAVNEIADELNIDKHQKRILQVAALFHDLGYTRQIENHETAGAAIAEKFLLEYKVDPDDIRAVKDCILATHYPQRPEGLLQEIICDADMAHLANKNLIEFSQSLRKEWEQTKNKTYTDKEWLELNLDFLSHHRFQTSYGRENLEKQKRKNIKSLKKMLQNIEDAENKEPRQEKKFKEQSVSRGVETLFRMASSNHMRLSAMADTKAHILLSINSIIISVILSVLAKKVVDSPYLLLPTVMLLCVSAVTIVYAVLTTKPKVSKGIFTVDQINKREANLLFFGNFHQMDLDVYEWGIQEMMYDKDYLYKSMTKDIYFLGKVLAAKYRYLNIGYRVFMYGLIASILAFGSSFLIAWLHVHS